MARATCKDGKGKVVEESSAVKDPSAPIEEAYGPWVLVTRKKQVARKGLKDLAHPFQFGVSQQPKVRA